MGSRVGRAGLDLVLCPVNVFLLANDVVLMSVMPKIPKM